MNAQTEAALAMSLEASSTPRTPSKKLVPALIAEMEFCVKQVYVLPPPDDQKQQFAMIWFTSAAHALRHSGKIADYLNVSEFVQELQAMNYAEARKYHCDHVFLSAVDFPGDEICKTCGLRP